jgi:intein/homing endonuclease
MVTIEKNEELARLVALITCDGHLQLKEWRGLVSFYSNDIEELTKFNNIFKNLFNKEGRVYPDVSKDPAGKRNLRYKLFFISKEIATFLNEIGVPKGNKTNVNFLIPSWITDGNSVIKKSYLQAVYDCEGCIYGTKIKNGMRWRISLEMYKNELLKQNGMDFLEQIRKMLSEFNVHSSSIRFKNGNLRKDGSNSVGLAFDIEKSSFGNFYKAINFDNVAKRIRLENALKS